MMRKEKHREDVAFQDYRQDSRKVYKRQLREMKPNMEGYEKEKAAAVHKAAMSGGLEVVETDDGELVAVDKNGTFYSTADSTDFIENKPEKVAVDRLVTDLRKAEETRLRKRRDRGKGEEEGDVTYINDKVSKAHRHFSVYANRYHRTRSSINDWLAHITRYMIALLFVLSFHADSCQSTLQRFGIALSAGR